MTVLILCAMLMIVRFVKRSLRKVSCSSASVSTSTAAVASSSTKTEESVKRARARDTSCFWPWERFEPPSWTAASRPPGIFSTCGFRRACSRASHSSSSFLAWLGSRLSRIVPSNSAASWGIIASLLRKSLRPIADVSILSISMPPDAASMMRKRDRVRELLPA